MRRWVQTYLGDFYSTHELCLPHHFLRYVATFEFSTVYIVFLHFGDCGYVFYCCENLGGAWILMFSCTKSRCKPPRVMPSVVCTSMCELTTADFEGLVVRFFLNAICFLAVVALVA